MYKCSLLFVSLLCLFQIGGYSQEPIKLTYGGNGDKFNGTVSVTYFAESENKRFALDSVVSKIDLNEYRGNVKFIAQVSDLHVGLNGSYDGIKNSDHPKVFYLEMVRLPSTHIKWVSSIAADTVKISAKGGHFGKDSNKITFGIKQVDAQKEINFRFKLRIRDGVYDRDWDGPIISKKITVLPKIIEEKDTLSTVVETEKSAQRQVYYDRRRTSRESMKEGNTLEKPETIEDKLWAKIEQDLISDNKKNLLQRCQIYKMNCDQHIFTECEYAEDVLFFMANLVENPQKPELIAAYKNEYPDGKYIDKVDELIAKPKTTTIPLKENFAKLDFDDKILLINRVEGGNRPYHIGFFDYSKNKEYAIKSIGFNREDISISLSELEIAEGSYTVKVRDSVGQVFVEESGIHVSEDFRIPNSVKLIAIVALLGIFGLLYKRYIYF